MSNEDNRVSRRDWLASVTMGAGLVLSYGLFAIEGLSFILPKQLKPPTRKLFAGVVSQYDIGKVKSFYDPSGKQVLIKRDEAGFKAFSATCPHLGCQVRWEEENNRFFCPCHKGVFDPDGNAIGGPPADGDQDMYPVPLDVDAEAGVIYVEVKVTKGGKK